MSRLAIIGGYLGAGKSTLVNRLLAGALPGRTAVVVNDFGAVNIDASLITAADDDTIELSNGCICCQISDDALRTMAALAARDDLDHVVCEVSGVGDPGQLADWRTHPGFTAGPVLVCAAATSVAGQLQDTYIGDAVAAQLAAAEVVLVTKTDLASPAELDQALAACRAAAPEAEIIVQDPAAPEVSAAAALSAASAVSVTSRTGRAVDRASAPTAHTIAHETRTLPVHGPVDIAALRAALEQVAGTLVRAKGIVTPASGTAVAVQLSGRRVDTTPTTAAPTGGFVLIANGANPTRALDAAEAVIAPILSV